MAEAFQGCERSSRIDLYIDAVRFAAAGRG
jgi:hypothetical protein